MTVHGITGTYMLPQETASSGAQNLFDQDTFLKLLVAQLQNPSPFSPPDADKTMEQAVQFGILERLMKVEEAVREMSRAAYLAQAAEMVGREVVVLDGDDHVTGTVESVLFNEKGAQVVIGGESYTIDQVVEVRP